MVRDWTMRFEAKHQYLKKFATSMGNFINLHYSLAQRHQCYQCYNFQDDGLFESSIESGHGKEK